MKHTKKLIPAIGMLLLSACMLVTSTFAWFSMNTSVTATGMTVNAVGDQVFLQINNKDAGFADITNSYLPAQNTVTTEGLTPAALIKKTTVPDAGLTKEEFTENAYKGGDYTWVTNVSDAVGSSTAVSNYKEASTTAYWLLSEFDIRLDSTAGATTAFAPLRVSGVTGNIAKTDRLGSCVNVLVVGETVNGKVYTQLWKQTSANNFEEFEKASNGQLTADNFNYKDNAPLTVKIYVYFDGENANCTIAALKEDTTLNSYTIGVSFTVNATA